MKRTPLRRKTPLLPKPGKHSAKRKPLPKRNPERYAKRHAEQFGEQAALCRMLPCRACWAPACAYHLVAARFASVVFETAISTTGPAICEAHHEPPRSCGGKDADTVPLCTAHHRERHNIGRRAFEAKYQIDLQRTAAELRVIVEAARSEAVPAE
jgi:hypothetical protein